MSARNLAQCPNRKQATAAEGVQSGALGSHGIARCRVVQSCNGGDDLRVTLPIVRIEWMLRGAGFDSESPLAGGWAELFGLEALVDVFRPAEAIKTSGREDERVAGTLFQAPKTGIDVAADFYKLEIGAECENLCPPAWAGRSNAGSGGQRVQGPVRLADEGITGIGALWDCGQLKARIERGRKVLEGVDRGVDLACRQCSLDFANENALAIKRDAVECGRRNIPRLLHAVSSCADDPEVDGVALGAEEVGDVMALPEGELRAAGADAKCSHDVC